MQYPKDFFTVCPPELHSRVQVNREGHHVTLTVTGRVQMEPLEISCDVSSMTDPTSQEASDYLDLLALSAAYNAVIVSRAVPLPYSTLKSVVATLDHLRYCRMCLRHGVFKTSTALPVTVCEHRDGKGDYFVTSARAGGDDATSLGAQGLLPIIVDNLLRERKREKKLMKTAPPEKRSIHNGRQLALKLSANSVYGFTAAYKYPAPHIARSVTYSGRRLIRETQFATNFVFGRHGLVVAYGDTDSIMVSMPSLERQMPAVSFKLGATISEFCTGFQAPRQSLLELEKVFDKVLFRIAKKYVGLVREAPEHEPKMDCKGIMLVRRDACLLARETLKAAIFRFFETGALEDAAFPMLEAAERLYSGTFAREDVLFTRQLRKSYAVGVRLPHTEVVAKIKARTPGMEPKPGSRVTYVVVVTKNQDANLFDKAEDPDYAAKKGIPLDRWYIFRTQLYKPLVDLLGFLKPTAIEGISQPILEKLKSQYMSNVARLQGIRCIADFCSSASASGKTFADAVPLKPNSTKRPARDASKKGNQKRSKVSKKQTTLMDMLGQKR